jgi:hypothetical protein
MKWLFLVHQVHTPNSRERVKVWRLVQKVGAVLYRNSVYVLPYNKERLEDFQWLCQQINDSKGDASVFVSETRDAKEDKILRALFTRSADKEYGAVLAKAQNLLERIVRAKAEHRVSERLVTILTKEAKQLSESFALIQGVDFFSAPLTSKLRGALEQINKQLSGIELQQASPPPQRHQRKEFDGRTWATRHRIHIDRLCSAWLIRRVIDPKARFVFAPESKLPKNALLFDVFGAEFSHHGEDCTFETLLKVFQLKDPALCALAEIIHDVDMKDGKFGRVEAAGLDLAVRALGGASRDDHETLKAGTPLLDALYRHLATTKPKGSKG